MNNNENTQSQQSPVNGLWQRLRKTLKEHGVQVGITRIDSLEDLGLGDLFGGLEDLEDLKVDLDVDLGDHQDGVKVVCVSPDLKTSADEMKETQRDQVVMVRVDEETRDRLDDWVRTGAVKSRSEAAALFIREGLSVRQDELESLRGALREVEEAQQRLRDKASQIFGAAESSSQSS